MDEKAEKPCRKRVCPQAKQGRVEGELCIGACVERWSEQAEGMGVRKRSIFLRFASQ